MFSSNSFLIALCFSFLCAFLKSIKRRRPCRKESPFALNCCRAGSTFLPWEPWGKSAERKIDQDATGPLLQKGRGLFLMTTRALQQSVVVEQVQRKCILCVGVPPSLCPSSELCNSLSEKTTAKVSCNKIHFILHFMPIWRSSSPLILIEKIVFSPHSRPLLSGVGACVSMRLHTFLTYLYVGDPHRPHHQMSLCLWSHSQLNEEPCIKLLGRQDVLYLFITMVSYQHLLGVAFLFFVNNLYFVSWCS